MRAKSIHRRFVPALIVAFMCSAGAHATDAAADAPLTITRAGSVPSARGTMPGNFTGNVRVDLLHAAKEPWHSSAAYVTFEPGARSVWHTHLAGQVLIVTAGVGRIQREGGTVESIRPGDTIWIPPGVKHWHGAGVATSTTHLAITESVAGKNVDWLEPVKDEAGPR